MVEHGSGGDRANGKSNGTPVQGKMGKILADRPSKDGSAQKAAQEVEGLKGYQLGNCLGRGAFGSVYQALNWETGQTVAIKQVRLENLQNTELKVIMLEIDLLKKLNHSNIVKYHGFVKSVECLYIILEYCENGSLHTICKNFGKFPENLVALYMSQVLKGLLYLHEQGVIHRDIKGANLLLTKDGLVKLADFGVATMSTVNEFSVVGTPYWMAPEVIQLSGASTASDIWSLGCTVIELLDGKPPYHKLQPMQALFKIVNDDHPPLPEGASPAVRDFLMQCFQKDPNLRVSAKKLLKHPWIANVKRAEAVVSKAPMQYSQAVESVKQWNEALKSPDHDSLRKSRPASLSPLPSKKELTSSRHLSGVQPKPLVLTGIKPSTDAFRSPELENDIWDADFASAAISPNGLRLPQHLRPQDNFQGMFSAENLKTFATFETVVEEGKTSGKLADIDPMETVKPYTPKKSKSIPKSQPPNTSSIRQSSQSKSTVPHQRNGSKSSQNSYPKVKSLPKARPSTDFREDAVDDYSDLLGTNADVDAFQKKLQALKNQEPKSTPDKPLHLAELKVTPKPQYGRKSTSLRRFPSSGEKAPGLTRTKSSIEIQKYAEDDDEDLESFLEKSLVPLPGSDSGSDRGNLLMSNSKLSNNSHDDDDEYDDPFAQFEEDFDHMDLEANVARDRYARQCTYVENLITELQIKQSYEELDDIIQQLMDVLIETPELKQVLISSHGLLPMLEILEHVDNRDIALRLLRIINLVISANPEMLENLCFVGGIPIVSEYAMKQFPSDIREEAANFVRQICQASTLALQMFVSCGGLNVLVGLLEEDLETERDLVLIGVNGVCSVFELQGPTPKNDFCRILTRSSILYPLSLILRKLLDESSCEAEDIKGRIVSIFLPFSQAENYVKEIVADRMVLKNVLKDLRRMSPAHQITMLKFIKNISMLASTHDALQNSNAIEVLTDLLSSSIDASDYREIPNQVLHILFNLCRLSKERQVDAALNGLIPILQKIVQTERPLKELALPILCDMAHSGNVGRRVLWATKGLQFYISLLNDKYWQVTALDAIFIWLQEETAKVEQFLLDGSFSEAIVDCFNNVEASPDAFENFLEPLQKLLILSPMVASTLAHPDLFIRAAQKLSTKKALVRGNLLRIIRSICEASEGNGGAGLIRSFGLYDTIERVAQSDQAIMVRGLASELIKSCDMSNSRAYEGRRPGTRRSSSSSTPSPVLANVGSGFPNTPQLLRAATGKSMLDSNSSSRNDLPPRSSRFTSAVGTPSSLRPTSHDGGTNSSGSTKSRLPRTSMGGLSRLSRLSLANPRREQLLTPTHSPNPTINPAAAARAGAAVNRFTPAQSRKRRVTSSGTGSTTELKSRR